MRRAARDAGFTLVELLAALVVLGLVMAVLGGGLRFGLAATRLAGGAPADGLLAADRALRGLIERADPGTFPEPATLRGTADALRLTTELPRGAGPARRADVEIAASAGRLVLRWRPHRHAQALGPGPTWREEVLADAVDHVAFAYYGDPAHGWSPAWTGDRLPALVRIELGFAAGSGLRWPPLIAAPLREPAEE